MNILNILNILLSIISGKISIKFLKEILPLVSRSVQSLVAVLLPEAIKIVADLATKGELSNKQKQKEAFTKIQEIAKEKGLSIGTSLVNLIVELAVTSLKK